MVAKWLFYHFLGVQYIYMYVYITLYKVYSLPWVRIVWTSGFQRQNDDDDDEDDDDDDWHLIGYNLWQ
jgi:hypothetical protein